MHDEMSLADNEYLYESHWHYFMTAQLCIKLINEPIYEKKIYFFYKTIADLHGIVRQGISSFSVRCSGFESTVIYGCKFVFFITYLLVVLEVVHL